MFSDTHTHNPGPSGGVTNPQILHRSLLENKKNTIPRFWGPNFLTWTENTDKPSTVLWKRGSKFINPATSSCCSCPLILLVLALFSLTTDSLAIWTGHDIVYHMRNKFWSLKKLKIRRKSCWCLARARCVQRCRANICAPLMLLKKIRKLLFAALRPRVSPRGGKFVPSPALLCVQSSLEAGYTAPARQDGRQPENLHFPVPPASRARVGKIKIVRKERRWWIFASKNDLDKPPVQTTRK